MQHAEITQDALGFLLVWAENGPGGREGEPVADEIRYFKTKSEAKRALEAYHRTALIDSRPIDDDRKRQAYMRRAVAELQKVHNLSERDAASIMLTVTSVVSLGPKSAN